MTGKVIVDRSIAQEVVALVKQGSSLLDQSVAVVRQKSSPTEADAYALWLSTTHKWDTTKENPA